MLRWCLLLGLVGCATLSKDTTVCPEYRNLRCASNVDCTFDNGRGCRVCQCMDPDALTAPVPALPPQR